MSNMLNGAIVLHDGKVRIETIDYKKKQVHFVLHKPFDVSKTELYPYIMSGCAYLFKEGFIPNEEELTDWTTHAEIVDIGESYS